MEDVEQESNQIDIRFDRIILAAVLRKTVAAAKLEKQGL